MNSYPVGQEWPLSVDGLTLNVRQDGAQNGIPVVLIHAFAGSLRQWDAVAETLAKTHWVVRLDLAGHGGSDKPDNGYSMPEQADRVAAIMTMLGAERFFAVGQSGGSNVVVALLDDPKHEARVAGGMLIAAPPDMSFVNLPAIANIYSVPLVGRLMWRITTRKMVSDTMANLFVPGFSPVPPIVVDDFKRMTRTAYVAAKAGLEGYNHSRSLSLRVEGLNAPLAVVFGDSDQWIPPACTEEWKRSTRAQITLMPGIGHTPPLEAPGEVARIISEFVSSSGA